MGNGPDDTAQKQNRDRVQEPTRPRIRPQVWPSNQSIDAQQPAANHMFRRNSERLQEAAAKRLDAGKQVEPERQLTFASDRSRGRFDQLKQEHAQAVAGESRSESGEKKLTFAKDRAGQTRDASSQGQEKKQEQQARRDLTFVKDRGSSRER